MEYYYFCRAAIAASGIRIKLTQRHMRNKDMRKEPYTAPTADVTEVKSAATISTSPFSGGNTEPLTETDFDWTQE